MLKLRITKTWRIIAIVVAIILVLYVLGYILLLPRFTAWLSAKYPEAFQVQKALQIQYPQKKIGVSDQTNVNMTGARKEERVLIVSVVGNNYLEPDEKHSIETVSCSALGQNAQKYGQIILQSTIEHRFLIFYARQSQSDSFTCHEA